MYECPRVPGQREPRREQEVAERVAHMQRARGSVCGQAWLVTARARVSRIWGKIEVQYCTELLFYAAFPTKTPTVPFATVKLR